MCAQKNIYEFDAKKLIADKLPKYYPGFQYHNKLALIEVGTDIDKLIEQNPWMKTESVVVKPDQLFGKRGKANLILLDANSDQVSVGFDTNNNPIIGLSLTVNDLDQNEQVLFIGVDAIATDDLFLSFVSSSGAELSVFSKEVLFKLTST